MSQFEQASRPVIFEQDLEGYPYCVKGSSFLIANENNYYWVTALHVAQGGVESLRIFPSDGSRISLPFNEKYTIKDAVSSEEEYKDIYMLRINLNEFQEFGDAPIYAQDIELGFFPAESLNENEELWVIGYPAESNFIDYDGGVIKNNRIVMKAAYCGNGIGSHCHTMKANGSIVLPDFDGLSGSPVFCMKEIVKNNELLQFPLFVGMVTRGTASSSVLHFISSSVLGSMVKMAEENA